MPARDIVFHHNREEIENFAAALEAHTLHLLVPKARSGDSHRKTVQDSMASLEEFARELIAEADSQDQPAPAPGQMALNRDDLRYLCYGIISCLRSVKDAAEESVDGCDPQDRLTGFYVGLWVIVDRWEKKDRQPVYDRLEQRYLVQRVGEKLLGGTALPDEWDTDEPVPEE